MLVGLAKAYTNAINLGGGPYHLLGWGRSDVPGMPQVLSSLIGSSLIVYQCCLVVSSLVL